MKIYRFAQTTALAVILSSPSLSLANDSPASRDVASEVGQCKEIASDVARLECFDQIASTAEGATGATEDDLHKEALETVASQLIDPSSAQFRNVRMVTTGEGKATLCGEVNGRNRYGGYVGFTPFSYDTGTRKAFLVSSDDPIVRDFEVKMHAISCERSATQ
jgi:hypothetical protein